MPANDTNSDTEDELLTPRQVADLFKVDPKTVTRWAKAGLLEAERTLGGHRRFWKSEVRRRLNRPVPHPAPPADG